MASITYTGQVQARAQVDRVTVTAAAAGATYTVAVAGRTETFTATTADVLAAAAGLAAAAAASTRGELAELAWAAAGPVVTVTGPADGAAFALTATAGAGGAASRVTAVAAASPHDLALAGNYAGGALPAAGDTLVFAGDGGYDRASALYGLGQFAAAAVAVERRAGHAGRIGLPDTARAGYREYRPTHLATAGTTLHIAQADRDGAGQVRLQSTAAGAVDLAVTGAGRGSELGAEAVEVYGLPAGSAAAVTAAGLALAPAFGQAAAAATLVAAAGAAVRVGPGAVLGDVAVLAGSAGVFEASFTGLRVDASRATVLAGAAGAGGVVVDGGEVDWRSAGSPGAVRVGSGGRFTLAAAPPGVAVAAVAVYERGEWADPLQRAARPYPIDLVRADLAGVTVDAGTHVRLTVGAVP